MITSPPDNTSRDQLTGWKEIASYLGKSVRTVQRWERRYELPVHRVPGSADVVLASKEEIERWKRTEERLEILDLDRGDLPARTLADTTTPVRVRHRSRRLTIAVLAVLAFVLLTIQLARRGDIVNRAADEDDAALFEGRPFTLQWKPMEEQQAPQRQPDGFLVDPGFVTIEPGGTVVFNYIKGDGAGRARPYAFARLQPTPESPRLRFSYVPHADARVSHWVGFIANSGFVRKGEEAIGYWVPQRGVALRLDRTNKAYVNSRAGIWMFAGGEPRLIAAEHPLSFQLDPGDRYDCTLEVDGWRVSATVSDGARVDALVGTIDAPVPAEAVFIADAHDGVSSLSPKGFYRLRFENVSVRDAQYKVDIALLTPATASPRAISLAILSSRHVDALALDQASLRLSGAAVLAGQSSQGFACRSDDMNGDGVYDLLCDFDRRVLTAAPGLRDLVLRGRTTYGRRVAGRLILPRSGLN